MANDYYNHGGFPAQGSVGSSATARAEFDAITAGFAKMPVLAAAGLKLVRVNAGATGLESTSLIDGITIGSVTPAAGSFTTLSATSNLSLTNGSGTVATYNTTRSFGVNRNWRVGVDYLAEGTFDFIPSTTLGGSTFSSYVLRLAAAGNVTIAAPSSGVSLTVNGLTGATSAISVTDGTVTSGWQASNASIAHIGTTSNHTFNLMSNAATRLSIAPAGNVTINAPSSGTAFLVTQTAGATYGLGTTIGSGNTSRIFMEQQGIFIWALKNTATSGLFSIEAGGADALTISTARNVTINAPSSGNALVVNSSSSSVPLALVGADGTTGAVMNFIGADRTWQLAQGGTRGGGSGGFGFYDSVRGVTTLSCSINGAFSIAAPSAGAALTLAMGSSGLIGQTISANASQPASIQLAGNGTSPGTTSFDIFQDSASVATLRNRANTSMVFSTNNTDQVSISNAGVFNLIAGSGSLRTNGHISRFESAEQTCPSTDGVSSFSHGGSRVPDQVEWVLRCKTLLQYNEAGVTDRVFAPWKNATTLGYVWRSAANNAPALRNKSTPSTLTTVTVANWRVVAYAYWL
jgi:hypothetical protein